MYIELISGMKNTRSLEVAHRNYSELEERIWDKCAFRDGEVKLLERKTMSKSFPGNGGFLFLPQCLLVVYLVV